MLKSIISLLSVFLLSACANVVERPYFYSLEKDGKTSYLLGSIHRGVPASHLPKIVHRKMDESQIYVSEFDLDLFRQAEKNEEERVDFITRMYLRKPHEPTLDKLVSAKAWQETLRRFKEKYTEEVLKNLSPFGLYSLVATEDDQKVTIKLGDARDYKIENSMDSALLKRAKQESKVVHFLETENDWDQLRDCLSQVSLRQVEEALVQKKNLSSELVELVEAYRGGSEEKVREVVLSTSSAEEISCMIADRNQTWAPTFSKLHSVYAPGFFVIGVGHLVIHPKGLIDLLREEGFTVRRVEATK